jgi:hypothetical protein
MQYLHAHLTQPAAPPWAPPPENRTPVDLAPPPAGAAAAAQLSHTHNHKQRRTHNELAAEAHPAQRLSRNPTPISLSQARGHTAHTRSRSRRDRARDPTPWASSLHFNDAPPRPRQADDLSRDYTLEIAGPVNGPSPPLPSAKRPPQLAQRPGWRLTADAFAPDCNKPPPALPPTIRRTLRRVRGRSHRW